MTKDTKDDKWEMITHTCGLCGGSGKFTGAVTTTSPFEYCPACNGDGYTVTDK